MKYFNLFFGLLNSYLSWNSMHYTHTQDIINACPQFNIPMASFFKQRGLFVLKKEERLQLKFQLALEQFKVHCLPYDIVKLQV